MNELEGEQKLKKKDLRIPFRSFL